MLQTDALSGFYRSVYYFNTLEYIKSVAAANLTREELEGKTILDVGCGTGDLALYLAQNHAIRHLRGWDIGEKNIALAKSRITPELAAKLEFSTDDIRSAVLPGGAYDLIWCDTVIELVDTPVVELLGKFKQGLRPSGSLYLSFTKKTFSNAVLYSALNVVNRLTGPKMKELLLKLIYVAILPKYALFLLLGRIKRIDHDEIQRKLRYLFIPYVRLIDEAELNRALAELGFKVLYCRDRIKSDPNSPPHTEVKAVRMA